MTRSLITRPSFHYDLRDIWKYTAELWSENQAEDYMAGLNGMLDLLCQTPEIARMHDFSPPVRVFPYRSHCLVFTSNETTVEMIRILHMRSNWRVILDQ